MLTILGNGQNRERVQFSRMATKHMNLEEGKMIKGLKRSLMSAVAVAFAFSGNAFAQGQKLSIGYAKATDFLPAFIAKENGC